MAPDRDSISILQVEKTYEFNAAAIAKQPQPP
jgi:hypothetical protein